MKDRYHMKEESVSTSSCKRKNDQKKTFEFGHTITESDATRIEWYEAITSTTHPKTGSNDFSLTP